MPWEMASGRGGRWWEEGVGVVRARRGPADVCRCGEGGVEEVEGRWEVSKIW